MTYRYRLDVPTYVRRRLTADNVSATRVMNLLFDFFARCDSGEIFWR